MKAMRKIVGVVLALIMVMGMSTTAFAEATNTTISVADTDKRTYEVYQIFTGDLETGKQDVDNAKLSNVKWGKNGTGTEGAEVPQETIDAIAAVNSAATDTAKLAVIEKYVNLESDAVGTVSAGNPLTVPTGYYLFKDVTTLEAGEAYSLYVTKIVGPTTFAPKTGTTDVKKEVKDVNDSTGTEAWGATADYDMGDDVPFKLTAKLAQNVSAYDTYKIVFEDTLAAGFAYNSNATVMFNGTNVTEYFTISHEAGALTISCDNVKAFGATDESVITVDYTAKLVVANDIVATGYDNKVVLKYSNNPNTNGEGSMGTTPEKVVTVYTYKVVVNKVGEDEKTPLPGAGFTLYKKNAQGEFAAVGAEVKDVTTFTWVGLDAGTYKLEESTTPNGYNTMDPITFEVKATTKGVLETVKVGDNEFTANAGVLTTSVVNYAGSILPSTGGMGTTIIYMIGGLMIIGAGATLVMRRRRAEEN